MGKNSLKAPYNYSASFWTSSFSISFWENPKTPHLHDFGISGRDHDSQNHFLYLWLHQDTPNSPTKNQIVFKNINFGNIEILELNVFGNKDFKKYWMFGNVCSCCWCDLGYIYWCFECFYENQCIFCIYKHHLNILWDLFEHVAMFEFRTLFSY